MTDLTAILADDSNYRAWVAANDPARALATWPRVTLQSSSSFRNGVNRRERASKITALKRAIEHATGYRLTLESRTYSETYGLRHSSYFTYTISRPEGQS